MIIQIFSNRLPIDVVYVSLYVHYLYMEQFTYSQFGNIRTSHYRKLLIIIQ